MNLKTTWMGVLALVVSCMAWGGCDKASKPNPEPAKETAKDVSKEAVKEVTAMAELLDAKGDKVGTARFTPSKDGVMIHAELTKLPPGVHAMHLHTVGECHGPDFKSAGAHFNPFGKKHGLKNPEGPHAGDLPNFTVKPDGTATVDVTATLVVLDGGKNNSLFQPGGTCIVIHEKADDEVSDPAGNAGARLACGVIKKM
jgi:superoxide dismutase, Cu-Zn family